MELRIHKKQGIMELLDNDNHKCNKHNPMIQIKYNVEEPLGNVGVFNNENDQ